MIKNYGDLQMFNMPYAGKARCQTDFFCRKILEMAYQFLPRLEGVFQESFLFREGGNQKEI